MLGVHGWQCPRNGHVQQPAKWACKVVIEMGHVNVVREMDTHIIPLRQVKFYGSLSGRPQISKKILKYNISHKNERSMSSSCGGRCKTPVLAAFGLVCPRPRSGVLRCDSCPYARLARILRFRPRRTFYFGSAGGHPNDSYKHETYCVS